MKNIFFICICALFAFTGCTDDDDELLANGDTNINLLPNPQPNGVINEKLFEVINLDYPGELVLFSVQCEFSFGDAVAIASDSSAEEGFRAVDNVVYAVVSEDNVCIFSIFIRYHDSENGASVISYGDFHSLFIFEDK